jgi:hypothetical protein
MKVFSKISFVTFFMFIFVPVVYSQNNEENSEKFYFYRGQKFGSVSVFNPINLILNDAYDTMQASNRDKNPLSYSYRIGFKNVIYNLAHPIDRVREYSWKHFRTQLYPTRWKRQAYYPNYQSHLIGGGMIYRQTLEWYRYHGYKFPVLFALINTTIGNFLTEIVENNSYKGTNVDPIADLYIFDTAGMILFSFDTVAEFFSKKLNMTDWSYQIAYNPFLKTFENSGQNFSIKYELDNKLSVLFYFGLHGMLGFSYKIDKEKSFSFAGGGGVDKLVETKKGDINSTTAILAWNIGFFYDIDNSLMTSLVFSGSDKTKLRLNVYPGVISFGKVSPGFFLVIGKHNEIIFGANLNFIPFGLASQFSM